MRPPTPRGRILPPKVAGPRVPAASRVRMYNVGIITPVYFPPPGPDAPGNFALKDACPTPNPAGVASSSPSSSSPSTPHVFPSRAPVARSTALISCINRSRATL